MGHREEISNFESKSKEPGDRNQESESRKEAIKVEFLSTGRY